MIVEAKSLPSEVTAGGNTVGVRMPDHPLALALLQRFGGAIATTSANRSDEPPATSAEEVQSELGGLVDIILDGGPTATRIASTVLDLSVSPPQIRKSDDRAKLHLDGSTCPFYTLIWFEKKLNQKSEGLCSLELMRHSTASKLV